MYIFALVVGIWGLGSLAALGLAKATKDRERAYKGQKKGRDSNE